MRVNQSWDVDTDDTELTVKATLEYGVLLRGFAQEVADGPDGIKLVSGGGLGGDFISLRQPGKPTITVTFTDLANALTRARDALRDQWRMPNERDAGEDPPQAEV